jgi:hypothetical protein
LSAAQLGLTALATVEAAAFVQRGDANPSSAVIGQTLAWVWLVLAAGSAFAATAWSSRRVLVLAALPLAAAVLSGCWLFGRTLAPHRLIANQRFVFAMLTSAVIAWSRVPLSRLASVAAAEFAPAVALVLMLLWGACESITWSRDSCEGAAITRWAIWLLGATAVAGAAGGWWRAHATGNQRLLGVGLAALCGALTLPILGYVTVHDERWMFANLRFGLVAAAVATAALWAKSDARWRGLGWAAFAIAMLGLTFEPPTWFLDHVDDRAEARRLALFSVTITWIATAAGLLVFGFRRDRRPIRLIALALFVTTAAKVLLLDMSGALQVYRILAFLIVGVVFVGASWAYHRAERRLAAARGGDGGQP